MEGPLSNLQASMIQFSKPRRTLMKSMDQFRRHEVNAREALGSSGFLDGMIVRPISYCIDAVCKGRRSGTPSRFDASFYRTHDPLGYIPSDVQSLKSQATYSSGLPMFTGTNGPFGQGLQRTSSGTKRSTYGSYASSIVSQDAGRSEEHTSELQSQ